MVPMVFQMFQLLSCVSEVQKFSWNLLDVFSKYSTVSKYYLKTTQPENCIYRCMHEYDNNIYIFTTTKI